MIPKQNIPRNTGTRAMRDTPRRQAGRQNSGRRWDAERRLGDFQNVLVSATMSLGAPSSSIWRNGTERILPTRSRRSRAVVDWEKCARVTWASALVTNRPRQGAERDHQGRAQAPVVIHRRSDQHEQEGVAGSAQERRAEVQMTIAGEYRTKNRRRVMDGAQNNRPSASV